VKRTAWITIFLDAAEFQRRVQAGDFLEHATVFGRSYGTLKSEVFSRLRGDRDVLLTWTCRALPTIREQAQTEPELKRALVTVFLTPASVAVLEERLRTAVLIRLENSETSWCCAPGNRALARFDYLLISLTIRTICGECWQLSMRRNCAQHEQRRLCFKIRNFKLEFRT